MADIVIPRRIDPRGQTRRRPVAAPNIENVPQVGLARDPGLNVPEQAFGDFSGQAALGQAVSGIGDVIGQEAVRQQNLVDSTESNKLTAEYQTKLKNQYDIQDTKGDWADQTQTEIYQNFIKNEKIGIQQRAKDAKLSRRGQVALDNQLRTIEGAYQRAGNTAHLRALQGRASDQIDSAGNASYQRARTFSRNIEDVESWVEILEETIGGFEGGVNANLLRDKMQHWRDRAIEGGLVGMALNGEAPAARNALKSGKFEGKLSPGSVSRILSAIDRAEGAERVVARAELNVRAENALAVASTLGRKSDLTQRDYDKVYKNQKLSRFHFGRQKSAENLALQAYAHRKSLEQMSNRDGDFLIANSRPDAEDPDFARKMKMWQTTASTWEQEKALRKSDAARAADKNEKLVQMRTEMGLTDVNGELLHTNQDYIRMRVEVQKEWGIGKTRQHTNLELDNMITRVESGKPAEVAAYFDALKAEYGANYRSLILEMGLEGKMDIQMGMAAGIESARVKQKYLAAMAAFDENKGKLGTGNLNDIMQETLKILQPFMSAATAGHQDVNNQKNVLRLADGVVPFAAQKFIQTGDLKQSVEAAFNEVLGDRFHITETWFAPKRIDGIEVNIKKVEDATDTMRDRRWMLAINEDTGQPNFLPAPLLSGVAAGLPLRPGVRFGVSNAGDPVVIDDTGELTVKGKVVDPQTETDEGVMAAFTNFRDTVSRDQADRTNLLNVIEATGIWKPNADQTGLVLVFPNNMGGLTVPKDDDGNPLEILFLNPPDVVLPERGARTLPETTPVIQTPGRAGEPPSVLIQPGRVGPIPKLGPVTEEPF